MNQGKLEVVRQEMARVNIDIFRINELKWTEGVPFSWRLGGCRPLQNEAEHLFPGHWLPEAH